MGGPDPAVDDRTLLAAWRAGDEAAFAALVGRHHRVVRAACRRQLPTGDVDDAVQAVFLILARRPAAAARAPVLAAWLLRVAHLAARNLHRRERRRRRAEALAVPPATPGHAPDPVQLDRLDAALMALRPAQRDALVLHVVGGVAPAEVADRLGTSRDHAYKLIQRGLAALRARLGGALPTTAALAAALVPAEGSDAPSLVPVLTGTPSARARMVATGIGASPMAWRAAVIASGGAAAVAMALAGLGSGAVAAPSRPASPDRFQTWTEPAPATTAAAVGGDGSRIPMASVDAPVGTDREDGPQVVQLILPAEPQAAAPPPRITMVVAGMRAGMAAEFLRELAGSPVTVDAVLADRPVGMDLRDTPLPDALAIFAAACDAEVEELPGGGYHLRARPAPRAQ